MFNSPENPEEIMKPKRPVAITILCLAGFFVCSLGMILVYSPTVLQAGKIYALYRSMGFTFLVVCFGGLWMMRRWAVWAFAGYFVVNQIVCLGFGIWDKNTLEPLLPLAITLAYYRKMK
jgi:hypothetical protein